MTFYEIVSLVTYFYAIVTLFKCYFKTQFSRKHSIQPNAYTLQETLQNCREFISKKTWCHILNSILSAYSNI